MNFEDKNNESNNNLNALRTYLSSFLEESFSHETHNKHLENLGYDSKNAINQLQNIIKNTDFSKSLTKNQNESQCIHSHENNVFYLNQSLATKDLSESTYRDLIEIERKEILNHKTYSDTQKKQKIQATIEKQIDDLNTAITNQEKYIDHYKSSDFLLVAHILESDGDLRIPKSLDIRAYEYFKSQDFHNIEFSIHEENPQIFAQYFMRLKKFLTEHGNEVKKYNKIIFQKNDHNSYIFGRTTEFIRIFISIENDHKDTKKHIDKISDIYKKRRDFLFSCEQFHVDLQKRYGPGVSFQFGDEDYFARKEVDTDTFEEFKKIFIRNMDIHFSKDKNIQIIASDYNRFAETVSWLSCNQQECKVSSEEEIQSQIKNIIAK
jgi:hypothetical protein